MIRNILSELYGKAVNSRNCSFYENKRKVYKCKVPVISVGNLSVGGTGKTPFVQMLTRMILEMNMKPAIVGRGYKRQSKGEVIISDGNKILSDAKTGGDEMLLLAESLPVPVIAHNKKYLGALKAEELFKIDTIIIDDGFQHRMLERDIDIVLLDDETLKQPYLLPKGKLREPIESLKRADVICLINNLDIPPHIFKIMKHKIILTMIAEPNTPYELILQENTLSDKSRSSIKSIIAISGIAKPKNFNDMLEKLDYPVIHHFSYRDHYNYTIKDINKIIIKCKRLDCNYVITTEKDAVKLIEFGNIFAENNINCYVFPISIKLIEGKKRLIKILKDILLT